MVLALELNLGFLEGVNLLETAYFRSQFWHTCGAILTFAGGICVLMLPNLLIEFIKNAGLAPQSLVLLLQLKGQVPIRVLHILALDLELTKNLKLRIALLNLALLALH